MRLGIIMFILLLPLAVAECPDNLDECDYSDSSNYGNDEFLEHSDPSKWDLSKVDWSNPKAYRSEIYLRKEAYRKFDHNLLDYNDPNIDHSQIDGQKYLDDLGNQKMSFTAAVSSTGLIKYSLDGIAHDDGFFVSVPGYLPEGTEILCHGDGIDIKLPHSSFKIDFPLTDTFNFGLGGLVLYNNHLFSGDGHYDKGTISTLGNSYLNIDGVVVDCTGSNRRCSSVDIYFSERDITPKNNYLLLDRENRRLLASGVDEEDTFFRVAFKRTNTYFDVEDEDAFDFEVGRDSNIKVFNRDSQQLVPEVEVSGDSVRIRNGENAFKFVNGKVVLNVYTMSKGSVPMTLTFKDKNGYNVLGSVDSPKKLIFDNDNNFASLSEDYDSYFFECQDCDLDLSESRLILDNNLRKFRVWGIEFSGTDDSKMINRLAFLVESLPATVRDSISEIEVADGLRFNMLCGFVNAAGCVLKNSAKIVLREEDIDTGFVGTLLYHEAAHTLQHRLIGQGKRYDVEKQLRTLSLELYRKYDIDHLTLETDNNGNILVRGYKESLSNEPVELRQEDVNHYLSLYQLTAVEENSYEGEMKRLSESLYDQNIYSPSGGLKNYWVDDEQLPRFGFMRPYGANNFFEDGATFIEDMRLGSLYNWYAVLMDPKSDYYQQLMGKPILNNDPTIIMDENTAQQWAEIYRQKFDIHCKYGFFTPSDCNKVLGILNQ